MSFGGGGSAGSTKSQGSTLDPWLSQINKLAFQQTDAGIKATGGLPAALKPNPYAQLSAPEQQVLDQAYKIKDEPLMSPLEQQGMGTLASLSDPTSRLKTASDLFSANAAPIISNNATVAGLGRGGAVPEALSKGFGDIALPIMQDAAHAGGQFGMASLALGPQLEQRKLARLDTAYSAAAAPRLARSAEYMRPLNTITSLIGGLPYGGGETYFKGRTSAQRGDVDVLTDVLVPLLGAFLGGGGGAAAAGCWVAEAIYGIGAPEVACARLWLRTEAPAWFRDLYLSGGQGAAEVVRGSRALRDLLRPLFDAIVQRGRELTSAR